MSKDKGKSKSNHKTYDQILIELQAFGFPINKSFLIETFGGDEDEDKNENQCTFDDAYQELLQLDFRKSTFIEPTFTSNINTIENDILSSPLVLQIVSIVNISQPSTRQHEDSNPRVLLIKLNDGYITTNAIEFERISDINTKIPPGSKILIKNNVRICCGKIFLNSKSCQLLGGRVDHIYKAWQTNRSTISNRKQNKQESNNNGEKPPEFELNIKKSLISDQKVVRMSEATVQGDRKATTRVKGTEDDAITNEKSSRVGFTQSQPEKHSNKKQEKQLKEQGKKSESHKKLGIDKTQPDFPNSKQTPDAASQIDNNNNFITDAKGRIIEDTESNKRSSHQAKEDFGKRKKNPSNSTNKTSSDPASKTIALSETNVTEDNSARDTKVKSHSNNLIHKNQDEKKKKHGAPNSSNEESSSDRQNKKEGFEHKKKYNSRKEEDHHHPHKHKFHTNKQNQENNESLDASKPKSLEISSQLLWPDLPPPPAPSSLSKMSSTATEFVPKGIPASTSGVVITQDFSKLKLSLEPSTSSIKTTSSNQQQTKKKYTFT